MATEKRLIDANDALEQLKQAEKEMKVVTPLRCKAVDIKAVLKYIESRPTVDAIPVSWLKEKLVGHPEISYAASDGIIAVLHLWEERKDNG